MELTMAFDDSMIFLHPRIVVVGLLYTLEEE